MRRVALCIACCLLLVACGRSEGGKTELIVSAASSLSDVMQELSVQYEHDHPNVIIRTNLASSGTLEQQIRQGAAADIFASAGERQMDELAAEGLVESDTRRVLVHNELVLAVPADTGGVVRSFADLASPDLGKVAMGEPASVPAGLYAKAALQTLGLWDAVSPKLVFTANVRQALAYVEQGEVDAALVYRTDAMISDRVRIADVAPDSSHPPITYPIAVVTASRHPDEARLYLDYLTSPAAAEVFSRYGFTPASEPAVAH